MEGCRHQQARSSKGIEAFSLDFQAGEDVSFIKTAKDARWQKSKRKPMKNELSHLGDGEAWTHFDKTWLKFAKDARNLTLGLATYVSIHLAT
jgi:hypothetical protein